MYHPGVADESREGQEDGVPLLRPQRPLRRERGRSGLQLLRRPVRYLCLQAGGGIQREISGDTTVCSDLCDGSWECRRPHEWCGEVTGGSFLCRFFGENREAGRKKVARLFRCAATTAGVFIDSVECVVQPRTSKPRGFVSSHSEILSDVWMFSPPPAPLSRRALSLLWSPSCRSLTACGPKRAGRTSSPPWQRRKRSAPLEKALRCHCLPGLAESVC